jgi:hypothetical protein
MQQVKNNIHRQDHSNRLTHRKKLPKSYTPQHKFKTLASQKR